MSDESIVSTFSVLITPKENTVFMGPHEYEYILIDILMGMKYYPIMALVCFSLRAYDLMWSLTIHVSSLEKCLSSPSFNFKLVFY